MDAKRGLIPLVNESSHTKYQLDVQFTKSPMISYSQIAMHNFEIQFPFWNWCEICLLIAYPEAYYIM